MTRYTSMRVIVVCGAAAACLFVFVVYRSSGSGQMRSTPQAFLKQANPTLASAQVKQLSWQPEQVTDQSSNVLMKYIRMKGRLYGLPSTDELKSMTKKELYVVYHSYLDNTEVVCKRKLRMGKVGDGGWEVCDDYAYRPVEPCIVYSFGIKNDFSFDDDVAKLYGCHVYSFDPSMGVNSSDRSPNVHFYNVGLGGKGGQLPAGIPTQVAKQNNWKVDSFAGIRAMLKHQQKPIDIVKMDIEHSEWLALPEMVRTGELFKVRQLLVEFHLHGGDNQEEVRGRLPVLKQLEDLGFRLFHTHLNPECDEIPAGDFPVERTTCYEVYYLNSRFVRE